MTNQEVFTQFGSEKWVVEQTLCFMMQDYWEKLHEKGYVKESQMPINPVSFIKGFMKEETITDINYAEKSKIDTVENNVVIDADYIDII